MSVTEPQGPAAQGRLAGLRDELSASGCSVVLEAASAPDATGGGLTLHVTPKSVVSLGRAVAMLRAAHLPLQIRGAGDAPLPARPGVAALDLSALDRIGPIDLGARGDQVWVEAGCTVAALEVAARRAGCTLGALLPSARSSSVGAWLSGPTRGQRGVPGARRESAALALSWALPDGRLIESRPAPRSAMGPDLAHLALGGGGRLAVVASAWVRLLPASEVVACSVQCNTLVDAVRAVERLCLARLAPARARACVLPGGAVRLAAAWEGLVGARLERARARRELEPLCGEVELGGDAGHWVRGTSGPQAVEVDARFGSLAAWAQRESGLPGAELRLLGLHAGGAFAVLQSAGAGDADACAAAARACGARVLAPRRLRDPKPEWEAQGAGGAFNRLLTALGAEERAR